MSIHIICGDCCFTCSITHWNIIRESISKATNAFIIDYLKHYNADDNDNDCASEEDTLENPYNKLINKQALKKKIQDFIKDVYYVELIPHPKTPNADSPLVIEFLKLYTYYLDLLTVLGVAGTFALINKGDTEGFYSIGNSHDIIMAISSVISFVENEYIQMTINDCLKVFKESASTSMVVGITFIAVMETPTAEKKKLPLLGKVNYNALKGRTRRMVL